MKQYEVEVVTDDKSRNIILYGDDFFSFVGSLETVLRAMYGDAPFTVVGVIEKEE